MPEQVCLYAWGLARTPRRYTHALQGPLVGAHQDSPHCALCWVFPLRPTFLSLASACPSSPVEAAPRKETGKTNLCSWSVYTQVKRPVFACGVGTARYKDQQSSPG